MESAVTPTALDSDSFDDSSGAECVGFSENRLPSGYVKIAIENGYF